MPENEPIQSISRAIEILFVVAGVEGGMTPRRIAESIGVRQGTIYRILRTLEATGMLTRRTEPLRFMLGPAVGNLALVDDGRRFVAVGSDVLYRAHARAMSCTFWLLETIGGEVHVRLKCGPRDFVPRKLIWQRTKQDDYHKLGWIIYLAYAGPEALEAFYAGNPFEPVGRGIWGTRARFEQAILEVRRDRLITGVFSDPEPMFMAGAPIIDPYGRLVGAVTATTPESAAPRRRDVLVRRCVEAAGEIGRQLGESADQG
ncbi:MAG: IclR family transcriptional regulator [Planctomycetota bacterium]